MLTQLHIRNIKAWKDTKNIRLAPITVFFGANSSGKTSINQLLVMLRQTAQSPDRKRVLHTGDENTDVDLGTVQELVHGQNDDAKIEFTIGWTLPSRLEIVDPLKQQQRFSGDSMSFTARIAQHGDSSSSGPLVVEMMYSLLDGHSEVLTVAMRQSNNHSDKYELIASGYSLSRPRGRAWELPPPIRFYGFPDEVKVYFKNAGFVADLALELEKMLGRVYYLGPLREYPWRTYTWSGERPGHVGLNGERAVEALLAARDRHINPGFRARREGFEEIVARWLEQMGLINDFEVKQLAPGRKEFEVLIRTAGSKYPVSLTDVGFGISQVLPVVVECFYVPKDSTIVFEQPEIHLHPQVQAVLADLFIEATQSRENGEDRRIQLIIESHSEHFLRRLQRRIAEEKLRPQDAALYFCEPGPEGSVIRELQVDSLGNITNWPANFFGDEMADLEAMAEAAMQREKADKAASA